METTRRRRHPQTPLCITKVHRRLIQILLVSMQTRTCHPCFSARLIKPLRGVLLCSTKNSGWKTCRLDLRLGSYHCNHPPFVFAKASTRRISASSDDRVKAILGISPMSLMEMGMAKFKRGDVEGSLDNFNKVYEQEPRMRPQLWQRGLSQYYMEQYQEGAEQFRQDVAANPSDSEEAIWAFMCEVNTIGIQKAQETFLQVGRDPRPVLRAALESFETGAHPEQIIEAATLDGGPEHFYALLYFGLWHEAYGNPTMAKLNIIQAVTTDYGQYSRDYMAAVAKVHCQLRNWKV